MSVSWVVLSDGTEAACCRRANTLLRVERRDARTDDIHLDGRVGGAGEGERLGVALARCAPVALLELDVPKNAQRLGAAEGIAGRRVDLQCRRRELHGARQPTHPGQ